MENNEIYRNILIYANKAYIIIFIFIVYEQYFLNCLLLCNNTIKYYEYY